MKLFRPFLILSFVFIFTEGCNRLYYTNVIDIEIVEPGSVKILADHRKIAVRYNNCNVSPNPSFNKSYSGNEIINDITNLDSVASKIYYQHFVDELRFQNFFDTIIEVEPFDYSSIKIADTLNYNVLSTIDSVSITEKLKEEINVFSFSQFIAKYPMRKSDSAEIKYLHPKLGLYQTKELQNIVDSTNANLLISFDYFSSLDGMYYDENSMLAKEFVLSQAYWNFYDLKNQEYLFFYNRKDTIFWEEYARENAMKKVLPPQKDAVLNAADMSGTRFAQYLVPHWIKVQRMYYNSGHVELKETNQLIEDGKWLEAAEIWKANANNPNKSIAAKCKFNMGLVCEIQGHTNAALEWVVESYHVFGQENKLHSANCMNYIKILGQRKVDKKILDEQFQSIN